MEPEQEQKRVGKQDGSTVRRKKGEPAEWEQKKRDGQQARQVEQEEKQDMERDTRIRRRQVQGRGKNKEGKREGLGFAADYSSRRVPLTSMADRAPCRRTAAPGMPQGAPSRSLTPRGHRTPRRQGRLLGAAAGRAGPSRGPATGPGAPRRAPTARGTPPPVPALLTACTLVPETAEGRPAPLTLSAAPAVATAPLSLVPSAAAPGRPARSATACSRPWRLSLVPPRGRRCQLHWPPPTARAPREQSPFALGKWLSQCPGEEVACWG